MPRLNSRLEAEGAEYLVLGALLIEGVPTYKSYARMPGYDLIATDADNNRSARIQVKSRWATDFDGGFLIANFDCDFVVFVALNRGYRHSKAKRVQQGESGRMAPAFYVFPTEVARQAIYVKSSWGKVFLNAIPDVSSYRDNWGPITAFLTQPAAQNLETVL